MSEVLSLLYRTSTEYDDQVRTITGTTSVFYQKWILLISVLLRETQHRHLYIPLRCSVTSWVQFIYKIIWMLSWWSTWWMMMTWQCLRHSIPSEQEPSTRECYSWWPVSIGRHFCCTVCQLSHKLTIWSLERFHSRGGEHSTQLKGTDVRLQKIAVTTDKYPNLLLSPLLLWLTQNDLPSKTVKMIMFITVVSSVVC